MEQIAITAGSEDEMEHLPHPPPSYDAASTDTFQRILEDFQQRAQPCDLPLLRAPRPNQVIFAPLRQGPEAEDLHALYNNLIDSFFNAIDAQLNDVVCSFVSHGLVSPDVASRYGQTPLLAAVQGGHVAMVRTLLSLGARVNEFGSPDGASGLSFGSEKHEALRTPLQLAAQTGHLALVKILKNEYEADDSLIAPDGATALRLAAQNGHRDIVRFLPTRRGGEWLRWKTSHQKQMEALKRAMSDLFEFLEAVFWRFPKLLLWDTPKGIAVELYSQRHRIGRWMKRTVRRIPVLTREAADRLWYVLKNLPSGCSKAAKLARSMIWQFLIRVPKVLKMCIDWIAKAGKEITKAIYTVVNRLASMIHTTFAAIVSWFRRVTLGDIRDAILYFVEAICVSLPKALLSTLKSAGALFYQIIVSLFGIFGKCALAIIRGLANFVLYAPSKIMQAIQAVLKTLNRAFLEVLIFINPKFF